MDTALGERRMSYNRRRRRSRVRVSPLGYIVLSIIILVMLVGIYFIIWSMRGDKTENTETLTSSIIVTPTPSLPPIADTATPTVAPVDTPAVAPVEPAAETPPAATDTPKPPDTPQPDAKTPSPSQVKTAVDGKTTSRLNLRRGPGKTYDILGTYNSGTQLKVYALESDFYFVMVVKENKYGYMSAEYVEKQGLLPGESATPSPPVPEGLIAGTVSASEAAVRTMPTKEGNTPFATLVHGDAVYIYFRADDYYYIQVVQTGKKGYAYADYIRAEDSVPKGTPVP